MRSGVANGLRHCLKKAWFEKVTMAIGLYIGYEGKCYMT